MSTLRPTPGVSPRGRVVSYIDGFNLYHGLRAAGLRRFLWLDLEKLSKSLIRNDQESARTKYFTTRIAGPESKRKRQSTYLEALQVHCGANVEMYWGHYQSEPRSCRACGAVEQVPSEKKTDVNIAVEMLTDAFSDRFDTALLITADSDLVPAVCAIKKLYPSKRVVVAFPPERASAELQKHAHACFPIGRAKFSACQLPEIISKKQNGAVVELTRPEKWREQATPFGSVLRSALNE